LPPSIREKNGEEISVFNGYNALNKMPFDKKSLGKVLLDKFLLGEVSFVEVLLKCIYI
jgi:hypothetical protein